MDEEDRLETDVSKSYGKQMDLEKLVESLNEKIQKLETQLISG